MHYQTEDENDELWSLTTSDAVLKTISEGASWRRSQLHLRLIKEVIVRVVRKTDGYYSTQNTILQHAAPTLRYCLA